MWYNVTLPLDVLHIKIEYICPKYEFYQIFSTFCRSTWCRSTFGFFFFRNSKSCRSHRKGHMRSKIGEISGPKNGPWSKQKFEKKNNPVILCIVSVTQSDYFLLHKNRNPPGAVILPEIGPMGTQCCLKISVQYCCCLIAWLIPCSFYTSEWFTTPSELLMRMSLFDVIKLRFVEINTVFSLFLLMTM